MNFLDMWSPEPCLNIKSFFKTIFPGIGIPMLKIRRSRDRLIFNMREPCTGKTTSLYWDTPQVFVYSSQGTV